MLPLYYLQRSRMAEALHAYAGLKDSFAGGPGERTDPIHHPVSVRHNNIHDIRTWTWKINV